MREVEIKLTGAQYLGETVVKIDDQPVNFKKNDFGNYVCKFQTENDKINIKVFKLLDIGGIFWFLTQIFFFLISIFGILDMHKKENCMIIDFEADIDLKEDNKINLQVNPPKEDTKAINIETDLTSQEQANSFYLDTKAKNTLKILKITKIFLTLAIIVTAILVFRAKL